MVKKVRIASRTSTSPVAVPRTVRSHNLTVLTSVPAGKMTPIAVIPLLREDAARVRLQAAFQMMETADLLINEIAVNVKAYLVPELAKDRFLGMDDLNRSWEGKPPREGQPVVPFIEKMAAKAEGTDPILRYLGKHARQGQMINTAYHEAYNLIWNFRAKNRSPDIALRGRLLDTLAPAFWHHGAFDHIVPDFDQAMMDGNVALNVVNSRMPIKGLWMGSRGGGQAGGGATTHSGIDTDGVAKSGPGWAVQAVTAASAVGNGHLVVGARNQNSTWVPDVYAEMQQNGITVSLANIDLARKTQAFARMRQAFAGHDDDYVIDMLMDGLTVTDQAWKQPILLQEQSTIFGMSKRYATNGGDLTESVVNGATMVNLNFPVPRTPCGGVIMIVAEILPGQLFERTADPYLHIENVEAFPHALRDMLDPEPVEAVRNEYIDIDHATPNDVFGYAPMNHKWNHNAPCVGGRFLRPKVNAGFDEDRLRIWAVETQNPVLSQDFYLATTMHTKPFVNPNQDPFEVTAVGGASITGLTQFGPALIEASDDYEKVLEDAPQDRLEK